MPIVRLGPQDGDRLRTLRLEALRDAPDAFGGTLEDAATRPADDWRRQLVDLATFFAVEEGRDVGMARAARHPSEPGTGELLSMWVAPAARGHGVGDALIAAIVDWARGEGLRRLVLDVGDANGPAVALYARNGFVATGNTGTLPPPRTHVREHQRARTL
ncbi:Ribosomal protein S18 acetylase RimI [Nannocystis exedens]|uniref:Ribosomal protein S18 acetylase RimI n=1 Tax=Nannocystis exedens TaxID=54 RepID=A0A1I2F5Q1_9BACT|nr:GNAT family N-acetyltransferase [Nannocystis exedens]PCC73064.1 Mycothiol acetyltransferase [Nannocystis exedens]SFF00774.1 Ribosomal protein S18 acetylase RimI [Nannocystis exedens]